MLALSFLVLLVGSLKADLPIKCPPGVTRYADGDNDLAYWVCEAVGEMSVKKVCEVAYDRATGMCLERGYERLVKRDAKETFVELIEREALGEMVQLGTLYNARTSTVLSGFSLWSKSVSDQAKVSIDNIYSNVDVDMEKSSFEKTVELGVDASIALSFLGGLIQVSGSAHYLRDDTFNEDYARVSMRMKSTKKTETMPAMTPIDDSFCTIAKENTGPTHVVTSITYGLNAYFMFDQHIRSTDVTEEIGGSLKVIIKSIPSFQIEGEATVDIGGNKINNNNNVRVEFYGDAVITKIPGNILDSSETLNLTIKQAKKGDTPIRYQLTAIKQFCTSTVSMVRDLNNDLLETLTNTLKDLNDVKSKVTTLLTKDPSLRFPTIRSSLLAFKAGFSTFYNEYRKEIALLISQIKSGQADEYELADLVTKYYGSIYKKERALVYLSYRTKEIETIELVTRPSLSLDYIKLYDIGAASDNECIFKNKYATVYTLYGLPEKGKGLYDGGTPDESSAWFNSDSTVARAGGMMTHFLSYAKIIRKYYDDNLNCFLVRLDSVDKMKGNAVVLQFFKHGKLVNPNFQPPPMPPIPVCSTVEYSGFEITTKAITNMNSNVTGHTIVAMRTVGEGDGTQEIKRESTSNNLDRIGIKGLMPATEYNITTYYSVLGGIGRSEETQRVLCKTAPTTAPVLLKLDDYSTSSLSLTWSPPQKIAVPGDQFNYVITASVGGQSRKQAITTANSLVLDGLEVGVYYHVTVRAEKEGVFSLPTSLFATTLPYPPATPHLETKTPGSVGVLVKLEEITVDPGVVKDAVIVQYYKMDNKGAKMLPGTSQSRTVPINNSEQNLDVTVQLNHLASGVKYGIQAKLRLLVSGRLVETDFSEVTIVNVPIDGSDTSRVEKRLSDYSAKVNGQMDAIKNETELLTTELINVRTKTVSIMDTFNYMDNVINGLTKINCVKRGIRYSGTTIAQYNNYLTVYQCLQKCSTNPSCKSVKYESYQGNTRCALIKERQGTCQDSFSNAISANLVCYQVAGASTEIWSTCVMRGKNFNGKDMSQTNGITSIEECVNICVNKDGCLGVTYEAGRGRCFLKSKEQGDGIVDKNGFNSVSLGCLRTWRMGTCVKHWKNFKGADISSSNEVGSIHACVNICADKAGCLSVTYDASLGKCYLKNKEQGDGIVHKIGLNSVSLSCLKCTGLNSAWNVETKANLFPVAYGTEVTVTCPKGYTLKGNSTVICRGGNMYSFVSEPRCQQECTGLDTTWNVQTKAKFPVAYGTEVTVTCLPGYTFKGNGTVICRGGKTYSFDYLPAPICKKDPTWTHLGCWSDGSPRAIPTLEGTDSRLDGGYVSRVNSIEKCKQVVIDRGWTVLAIQSGGWCGSSADAEDTYAKYGAKSGCCTGGKGGAFCNDVYQLNPPLLIVSECAINKTNIDKGDIENFVVTNIEECMKKCNAKKECRAIGYRASDSKCWLKTSAHDKATAADDMISAYRLCFDRTVSECAKNKIDIANGDITEFAVDNIEECMEACIEMKECRAIAYRVSEPRCWLKTSAHDKETTNKDRISAYRICFDTDSTVASDCAIKKTDIASGDIEHFGVTNIEDCMEKCIAKKECRAIAYRVSDFHCFLKSDKHDKESANNALITAYRLCFDSTVSECAIKKTNIDKGDIENLAVANIEECMEKCIAKKECRAIGYRVSDSKCWLKTSAHDTETAVDSMISAYRSCFDSTEAIGCGK